MEALASIKCWLKQAAAKRQPKVIGIPDRDDYGDVTDIPTHKQIDFVVQKHDAARAGCFAHDTPILMADGSWKEISTITPGELVYTCRGHKEVLRLWNNGYVDEWLSVVYNGSELIVTPDHRFYVKNLGWVAIKYLASLKASITYEGIELSDSDMYCLYESIYTDHQQTYMQQNLCSDIIPQRTREKYLQKRKSCCTQSQSEGTASQSENQKVSEAKRQKLVDGAVYNKRAILGGVSKEDWVLEDSFDCGCEVSWDTATSERISHRTFKDEMRRKEQLELEGRDLQPRSARILRDLTHPDKVKENQDSKTWQSMHVVPEERHRPSNTFTPHQTLPIFERSHRREHDTTLPTMSRKGRQDSEKKSFGVLRITRLAGTPRCRFDLEIADSHEYIAAGFRVHNSHYDIRLGDTVLHSWASRKGLPAPGEKRLLIHQPLHSKAYASFEGVIPAGYGKGRVRKHETGSVVVTKAEPDQINFTLLHRKFPEQFNLIHTKGKHWLAVNTSPTDPYKFLGDSKAFAKLRVKTPRKADLEEIAKTHLVSAKLSGASNLFRLGPKGVDVLSYRVSKTGRPLIHTHKFMGLAEQQLRIPKELQGTVLRGEVYGVRGKRAISEQMLGGLLNASTANSLAKQREKNIQLRAAIFDIVGFKGSPEERRRRIQQILKHLPKDRFEEPEYAASPAEARELIQRISRGKHPLTSEGVVAWPRKGDPVKLKNFAEADVYVRGFSAGRGKYRGKGVGAIKYSLTPRGPIVGEVASGLTDETRSLLRREPADYIDRVLNIKHRGQMTSGAYFQPSIIAFHESK